MHCKESTRVAPVDSLPATGATVSFLREAQYGQHAEIHPGKLSRGPFAIAAAAVESDQRGGAGDDLAAVINPTVLKL